MRIYRVDLADACRDLRRHRWLLNLIDGLPGDSAYREAQCEDPELAELIASGAMELAEPTGTGPRLSEWTPERAALAEISDRIQALTAVTLAAAGAKPSKFTPTPRPDTAISRATRVAEERKIRNEYDEIVALFLAPDEDSG